MADEKEIKKLGQAVDRIARHADKLTAALRRLMRTPRTTRSAGRSPTTRKK